LSNNIIGEKSFIHITTTKNRSFATVKIVADTLYMIADRYLR
jgi:hypothetical protein